MLYLGLGSRYDIIQNKMQLRSSPPSPWLLLCYRNYARYTEICSGWVSSSSKPASEDKVATLQVTNLPAYPEEKEGTGVSEMA